MHTYMHTIHIYSVYPCQIASAIENMMTKPWMDDVAGVPCCREDCIWLTLDGPVNPELFEAGEPRDVQFG